ncbi:uncharacterized protein BXZ73DRAFT_74401 [Epithele typhae]|uniref:uncharacterized protein n=1 Tax=Epithele typhae TaxID=378194 RepID=UPI0020086F9B|nr:uncharacterized protein BXZ73DRAFT_74401 [Epithele typhae]KAH9943456.1 hypothetical protein BXZ73DRAFT_74401 [Epithele typhae]
MQTVRAPFLPLRLLQLSRGRAREARRSWVRRRPGRLRRRLVLTPSPGAGWRSNTAGGDTRNKARPKKKPGLQNILARNRERQEQEKERDGAQGLGLSAFLHGL